MIDMVTDMHQNKKMTTFRPIR